MEILGKKPYMKTSLVLIIAALTASVAQPQVREAPGAEAVRPTTAAFRVTVDYDRTIEDMVKAGKYSRVNPGMNTDHFPVSRHGKAEIEIVLVRFNGAGYMTGGEVVSRLDIMGFRPAELPELLAFGAAYPNEHRKFGVIIAPGSVLANPEGIAASMGPLVPELMYWPLNDSRDLTLDQLGTGHSPSVWFAAVRKLGPGESQLAHQEPQASKASGAVAVQPTITSFPVVVNYDQTVKDMVKAGKYDWSGSLSQVTSDNFPINHRAAGTVEIMLVHFHRHMGWNEAIGELDKMGLRPAELPELLAIGATYPEKQREFPIIALGSACCGQQWFPSLDYHNWDDWGRTLNVGNFPESNLNYRFAAARK